MAPQFGISCCILSNPSRVQFRLRVTKLFQTARATCRATKFLPSGSRRSSKKAESSNETSLADLPTRNGSAYASGRIEPGFEAGRSCGARCGFEEDGRGRRELHNRAGELPVGNLSESYRRSRGRPNRRHLLPEIQQGGWNDGRRKARGGQCVIDERRTEVRAAERRQGSAVSAQGRPSHRIRSG